MNPADATPDAIGRYGLFRSRQLESTFVAAQWAELAPRARAIGLWGGLCFVAGSAADYVASAGQTPWLALLLVRSLVLAAGLRLAWVSRPRAQPAPARLASWLLGFQVLALVGLRVVAQLHGHLSPYQAIAAVFACVVLYAFAPLLRALQFWCMPAWLLLAALQMRLGLGASWGEVLLFVLLLGFVNVIGWQLAAHTNRSQRDAWLSHRRLQREIAERVTAEQNLRHLFEVSPLPLVLVGQPHGQLLQVNPAARDLLDPLRLLPDPALAMAGDFYADAQTGPRLAQALAQAGAVGPLDLRLKDSSGQLLDVMLSARRLRYNGRRAVLASLVEITHRKRHEHELRRLAHTDSLTALYNRRGFFARAERLRRDAANTPLALLALDVDHFKAINDNHGHATGDLVLQQLAGRIAAMLRDGDVLARIGGEEFAALLPATDTAQALEVAERVRRSVCDHALRCHGLRLRTSVSVGVTLVDALSDDIDNALARADAAMYRAKQEGRNRVRWQPAADAA